jgi:hypothetical protein
MGAKKISDEEFIDLWNEHQSITKIAAVTGMDLRGLKRRRNSLEIEKNIKLRQIHIDAHAIERKIDLGIKNGTVIVFSDAHFWPGIRSTAFKGLLYAIGVYAPTAVIANGDIFDGASISRHARIGWDKSPSVIEELKACQACMSEIEEVAKAARHNVRLLWPLGNHDARFETFLAANAPQFEHTTGFKLSDHFQKWKKCWSVWLNEKVVVKHRNKGGIHATHNNTVQSGVTMVTGHLHSLKVTPYVDYNGVRYGVDTGTLADIYGPQFENYLEQNPVNWRSGFAILTFVNGVLLIPELVMVHTQDTIQFRGEVIDVGDY